MSRIIRITSNPNPIHLSKSSTGDWDWLLHQMNGWTETQLQCSLNRSRAVLGH